MNIKQEIFKIIIFDAKKKEINWFGGKNSKLCKNYVSYCYLFYQTIASNYKIYNSLILEKYF